MKFESKVFERFIYWIRERESIREKKEDLKLPKPWTDDPILRSYRFCNVRRMDDKVSKWLLKNWYKPNKNHPLMVPAVACARFFNLPESLEPLGKEIFRSEFWNPEAYVNLLRDFRDEGNTVFNGAYLVRGLEAIDKIDCVINHYVCNVVGVKPKTQSMKKTHGLILQQYGFGSFMAGQIVADLRHALTGTWADKRYWAPIGPGSSRGLRRLQGRPLKPDVKQEEFDVALSAIIREVSQRLPEETKGLEAIDFQNCLCEFDKYERVLHGEGRPKSLYQGA